MGKREVYGSKGKVVKADHSEHEISSLTRSRMS